jgi:hypothetical protein
MPRSEAVKRWPKLATRLDRNKKWQQSTKISKPEPLLRKTLPQVMIDTRYL